MNKKITCIFVCLWITACAHKYTPHNPKAPTGAKTEVQQIAALAFVSYAGDELVGSDQQVDDIIESCVAWELERQPILKNRRQYDVCGLGSID